MKEDILTAIENGALLLDVRPETAFEEGHIDGSQNLPLEELATANLPEDKDQAIYVHCRLGIKSKEAKTILEDKGYTNVIDLGSIDDMLDRGFEFTGAEKP